MTARGSRGQDHGVRRERTGNAERAAVRELRIESGNSPRFVASRTLAILRAWRLNFSTACFRKRPPPRLGNTHGPLGARNDLALGCLPQRPDASTTLRVASCVAGSRSPPPATIRQISTLLGANPAAALLLRSMHAFFGHAFRLLRAARLGLAAGFGLEQRGAEQSGQLFAGVFQVV